MDSQTEEIRESLFAGNFSAAFQIAKTWLDSLPLSRQKTPEYKKAEEAFLYSRYFLHRHERINRTPSGEPRARLFLEFLEGLEEIRKENSYDRSGDPHFWETVSAYIHAQIADGFAKAFAGQKSYNLEDKDVIQLAVSLLKLGKWRQALEALEFLHRYNHFNPAVHLLMSFAFYNLNEEKEFLFHLREALFKKPELLTEYQDFLPPEIPSRLAKVDTSEGGDEYKARNYALLLEINGFYKAERIMTDKELVKLESEFQSEYEQYRKNREFFHDLLPRLLLTLCWILRAYKARNDFEKTDFYRGIMVELSPDTWEAFYEKAY